MHPCMSRPLSAPPSLWPLVRPFPVGAFYLSWPLKCFTRPFGLLFRVFKLEKVVPFRKMVLGLWKKTCPLGRWNGPLVTTELTWRRPKITWILLPWKMSFRVGKVIVPLQCWTLLLPFLALRMEFRTFPNFLPKVLSLIKMESWFRFGRMQKISFVPYGGVRRQIVVVIRRLRGILKKRRIRRNGTNLIFRIGIRWMIRGGAL